MLTSAAGEMKHPALSAQAALALAKEGSCSSVLAFPVSLEISLGKGKGRGTPALLRVFIVGACPKLAGPVYLQALSSSSMVHILLLVDQAMLGVTG